MDRDRQEKESGWDAVNANRRAFHVKKCSAKNLGLGVCQGQIVRAHTVSRSSNLSKIANDGHVMQYSADYATLSKNGGKLTPHLVGIAKASVFEGFCAKHDRDIFSCIENEPFIGRPDQCLATAYRTVSREIYLKDAASHLRDTLRGADKGFPLNQQIAMQSLLQTMHLGNELARREIGCAFENLSNALSNRDYGALASIIIDVDGKLPFMMAGAWSPFTDIYGNSIQRGFVDELLEQIIISSFVCDGGDKICISWLDRNGAPARKIAEQIVALADDQQASVIMQMAVKHIENVFYNPDWFNALARSEADKLYNLAFSGIDMGGHPPDEPVDHSMSFGLPKSKGMVEVSSQTTAVLPSRA